MGQRTAAILGFNTMTAGLAGAQADYIRVPVADVNCLLVPREDSNIPDEKLLFLSDILCTSWFGTELAEVKENDIVAIWGAGPVGLLAAQCSFARGARRVILVDNIAYRLEFAQKIMPKIETIDFSKEPQGGSAGEKKVLELCKNEPYHAPDACIECVGVHYAHAFMHRMEMALGLETDTPEALNAAIFACRKGGRIGCIGAYIGTCNHFNIGALMMKNISLHTGPIPVQKYWRKLYDMVKSGKLDPSVIITHRMQLDDAPKAYQIFNEKLDDVVKIVLSPTPASQKTA
jgi:threonine dehydrogenase-like Zn-dependent dehydrogenase